MLDRLCTFVVGLTELTCGLYFKWISIFNTLYQCAEMDTLNRFQATYKRPKIQEMQRYFILQEHKNDKIQLDYRTSISSILTATTNHELHVSMRQRVCYKLDGFQVFNSLVKKLGLTCAHSGKTNKLRIYIIYYCRIKII